MCHRSQSDTGRTHSPFCLTIGLLSEAPKPMETGSLQTGFSASGSSQRTNQLLQLPSNMPHD